MPRSSPIADILKLLAELEARVQADPQLAAEWEAALTEQPAAIAQVRAHARFLEWFLLERVSEKLGASPLQAYAPDELEGDSVWARLLDNFLGIFRIEGRRRTEGREFLDVIDLWSGRMAHLPVDVLAGDAEPNPADLLLVGRLILADEEVHLPMPGLRLAQTPGLVAAVEADLALARHKQPRARLSQRECDAIFQHLPEGAEQEPGSVESTETLIQELESILSVAPGWNWNRVQDSLSTEGLAGTLDRLAFETQVDLEAIRRLLPALTAQTETDTASTAPQGPTSSKDLSSGNAATALEAYDQARAEGRSVAEAFREMEESLGLEPGISEEVLPDVERDEDAVGPIAAAGLTAWIESYQWENPDQPIANSLQDFATQTQLAAGKPLDAQDLEAQHVLPYLMASANEAELRTRRDELMGFLIWAAQEQNAPIGSALDDWANSEDERLPAIVRANTAWKESGAEWHNRQAIAELAPIRVSTESEELALVTDIPADLEKWLRPGDWLLGEWMDGRFRAARALPIESLPTRPQLKPAESSAEEVD
ncbi:MAG: hypothetical protein MK209_09640 [Planctomycetes bacterium]|nr:hypothetical protein [Planctomycetota bacterium]